MSAWQVRATAISAMCGLLFAAHELGPLRSTAHAASSTQAGEAWVARYDGSGNWDTSTSIVASPDGRRVFVTGKSQDSNPNGPYDAATVAYDSATGAQLWVARYHGSVSIFSQGSALAVSADGRRVFVTGVSFDSGSDYDYATVAYNAATGAQLWVARYHGPGSGYDQATAIAVSPNGSRVFVTGSSQGVGTSGDYATIAYAAATGAQLWVARHDGQGHGMDQATALAVGPDGKRVFITGYSQTPVGDYDYATLAYNATTGAQLWIAIYAGQGSANDQASSLVVSPDGARLYVTGWSAVDSNGKDDYMTIAYNAVTGTEAWRADYNGPGGLYDEATSITLSPDGSRVYITGGSFGVATGYDYATIAYDAPTGAQLWVARYDGPGRAWDEAHKIVVTPDGSRVYVTGQSIGVGSGWDFATVGYDAATGAQVWVARYDGPTGAWSEAASLAMSPDGSRIYVTGESFGGASSFDYATVAYWTASTCASGGNEVGPVSAVTHGTVEPAAGPAAGALHTAACTLLVPEGL